MSAHLIPPATPVLLGQHDKVQERIEQGEKQMVNVMAQLFHPDRPRCPGGASGGMTTGAGCRLAALCPSFLRTVFPS